MNTAPSLRTVLVRAVALFAIVAAILPTVGANAVEFPDPSSPLYFQTSGPEAGLNIGDWYTDSGAGATDHVILLPVPSAWPATQPVTVAVYDPESYGGSTGLATNDEVRGTGDTTRFALVEPGSGTLASATFASSSATHGRWVEILTFLPTPGTVYELHTETGVGATVDAERNDDNSWRLSFTSDPDCAVGQAVDTCSGIDDGDESDDADGTPGTGDELAMGFQRASYQYSPGSTVGFWFYVDATVDATVTLHNFDLDNNGGATYRRANGTTVTGTVSGPTRWNNSSDATRVGDVVSTAGSTGWWRADIQASGNNQFIFEVDGQVPVYFAQPPTPILDVTIDDSDADIAEGEPHTYVITVDNTSDATGTPGAAMDTTVTVPLPAGVVYDGCTVPTGITCALDGSTVRFTFTEPLDAGADVTLGIDVTGGPGMPSTVDLTATARYEDQLGNEAAPVSATDSDTTLYPDLSVTIAPDTSAAPGDTVTFDVDIANVGMHIQPGTIVTVPIPTGVAISGSGTDARWSCSDGDTAPATCSWTVGTMNPSDTDTATIAFTLPSTIGAGVESLDVSASISGDYAEVVTANNDDLATITIDAAPDLAIVVDPPATYVPGSESGWAVTVANVGAQDATGVVATVVVPIDADAAPATGWSCSPNTSTSSICTYAVGDLAAGADTQLPFPVDTDPAAIDPATLDASVADDGAGGPETDLTNNDDSATITPNPLAELTMDVVVTVDPINVGDATEFTFTVGNNGPSVARSTVVLVEVPADLGSASVPAGCSTAGTLRWLCSVGDLDPGDSVPFTTSGVALDDTITLSAAAASPTDPDGAMDADTAVANRPPVAQDGTAETQDRDPVTIPVPATDPDDDPLAVTVTAPEGTAVVTVGPDGPVIEYTPADTTAGTVVLDYEACDPDGLCDTATIEVLVKRAFLTAGPMCIADAAYVDYSATIVGVPGSPNVTVTWSDGSNTFSRTDLPTAGLALWPGTEVDDLAKAPGDRVATDWPGWLLEDGIWVAGDDGFAWSREAGVTVTVTVNPTSDPVSVVYPAATIDCAADADGPTNRPPTGTDLSGWASSGFPYTADLLAGTDDPDGDIVSITSVTPVSGKAVIVDGVLTYTPAPGDTGTVVFDVEITDGRGEFATFTVTIDVAASRDMSGVTFVDADGDGVFDTDEDPVGNAAVTITHPGADGTTGTGDDIILETRTNPDGTWAIDDVPAGEVVVTIVASGRTTRTVVTDEDFVLTAYEEQLPVTGAELIRIGLVALILMGLGTLAVAGGPRRRRDEES